MIQKAFHAFFDSSSFMPHGHCYLWLRSLLILHIASDCLITLSYYSIPITLVYFAGKRPELPYRWMLLMFGAFIVACGTTHLMEIVTIYIPIYWVSGSIKALTALLSMTTAIALIPLVPKALTLHSPDQLEATNQELRLVNKELEAFSYSISHDLRAPLRGIDGFTRIVMETQADRLEPEGLEQLRRVRASTKRMGMLIDDLLTLARVARTQIHSQPVDLSRLAEDILSALRQNEPQRHVRSIIAGQLTVVGDLALLRVVLENLLGNAWKFTSKQSEAVIELGCQKSAKAPIYFVRDNGAGFDMAYIGLLFGPFQRLHSGEEFAGNGVGLATVQRIIHRHGGRIWAEGRVDHGAVFYFELGSQKGDSV